MKTTLLGILLLTALNSFAQKAPDYYEGNHHSGANQRQQQDIKVWCNDRLKILRRARQNANKLNYQGRYQAAVNTLKQGLSRAHRNAHFESTPISHRLLSRGIKLSSTLTKSVGSEKNGHKAISYFMNKYVLYVENAMRDIDIPYYENGDCGYCNQNDNRGFEIALINLARLKLELVNDTLISSRSVTPLGPSVLYLKAMEVLSYYSRVDLKESLYANEYSCQIQDLGDIHYNLRNFNPRYYPRGVKRMVLQTFHATENVISELNINGRCY